MEHSSPSFKNYLLIDVDLTDSVTPAEIVEFVALLVDGETLIEKRRFHHIIGPTKNMTLLATKPRLKETMRLFESWLNWIKVHCSDENEFAVVTWGDDIDVLLYEKCEQSDAQLPAFLHAWIDIQELHRRHRRSERSLSLGKIINAYGLEKHNDDYPALDRCRDMIDVLRKLTNSGQIIEYTNFS
ncbi:uncharacterized protein LOC141898238 [Tubulanus polymorphus]|uniref:uncharacterized protein LOC141898238 n=1 Tax=Tubulanus polymorphus TaxID=672921 RepID=UPI003DA5191A